MTALTYYRNIVEAHAAGTVDKSRAKELLGLEPGYTSLFEHSLKIIPASELSSPVDWRHPLGCGANGTVYTSTWNRPGGVLSTTERQEIEVVIKDVLPDLVRDSSSSSRSKFMKEVRNRFLRD